MGILPIVRAILLAVVVLFSFIVLVLAAHLRHITHALRDNYYYDFSPLAIAVSIITILAIIPLLVIDHLRVGAFTSKIIVELAVLGLLAILWLATGADTSSHGNFLNGCTLFDSTPVAACHEVPAVEAFAFLNWLILLGYSITISVLSVIAGTRGNIVWTSSVKEANFFASAAVPGRGNVSYLQTPQTPYSSPPQMYLPSQPQLAGGGYSAGRPQAEYSSYNSPNQEYMPPYPRGAAVA